MGLQVQLAGCILLLLAAFEIWRFLVTSMFALIVKAKDWMIWQAGLLTNISVNPHTKISVTAARIKISLWKHLWPFLRAPKRKKLVVLTLPFVHMHVVKSSTRLTQRSQTASASPQFWQTLNTRVSLKDIQHPCWSTLRVWFPRLNFLFRWLHVIRLNVHSFSVDVMQHDDDTTFTPVFSIQHGSVYMHAAFQPESNDLLCYVTISRTESMEFIAQGLKGTTVLGRTKCGIRVPVYRSRGDLRAPIPSAYSLIIDLVELSVDLEQTLHAALCLKQQLCYKASTFASYNSNLNPNFVKDCSTSCLLRLAAIMPDIFRCEIGKLTVNVVDRVSSGRLDTICSLKFSGFSAGITDNFTGSEDVHRVKETRSDFPQVTRKAEIKFALLALCLNEARDVDIAPPIIKLDEFKLHTESTLSANNTIECTLDKNKESDGKQQTLCFRSTISGSSRNLNIVLSKRLQPWMDSWCTIYDATVFKQQGDCPLSHSFENDPVECWSVANCCYIELEAELKVLKTVVSLLALDRTCEVLPKGVPSIQLVLGEISVYCHPFESEDRLGIRAKADIQCSRLQAFYFTSDILDKSSFLSISFVRVFVFPVETIVQSDNYAEVEMEIEWVEVKWSSNVMHAIGGAMELGVFALASFLHELRQSASELKDTKCNFKSRTQSYIKVAPMRLMVDVAHDLVSNSEVLVFRCIAKRICVMFPYLYCGQRRVDCVTVNTFAVSSEGSTGRLRFTFMDAKAFPSQRSSGESLLLAAKQASFEQGRSRIEETMSRVPRTRIMRGKESTLLGINPPIQEIVFFAAKCFSLEENQVVGSTKTVVDMFVNGVQLEWDLSTQLRILELIRRITISSYEMIYRARSAYAIYCTLPDSIYNRVHGLNSPLNDLDECLRYESQFADLISASGDNLTRLHATDLSINAKLCNQVGILLTIGVLASDDLPEDWLFQNISIRVNALEMASVARVRVRHTLNKDNDHVYGVFEDILRNRLFSCQRSTLVLDQTMVDGILVDINQLQLRTSHNFPLQAHVDAIQNSFDPFMEQISSAVSLYWRPQHEIFYQFFVRTPVAFHRPELWVMLQDTSFECLGNPFDSWLEQIYPVWIEEVAEQELRAHVLDNQIAVLKQADNNMHNDASYDAIKAVLMEKNARAYIRKVKKLAHNALDEKNGPLLYVSICHLNVDVSFEEDIAASWDKMNTLDEAAQELQRAFKTAGREFAHFTPSCRLFLGLHIKTIVTELAVSMRRFPTPLLTCDGLKLEGDAFITAFNSDYTDVDLMKAVRYFVNISIDVTCPVVYFNPGYLYALNEISRLAMGFLPLVVLDIDRNSQTSLVDTVRRLLHGNICMTINNGEVRLFCATTSFNAADYLEINVHRSRFAYSSGSIDIEVTRIVAKIEPESLSHIAGLSHFKLHVWLKWECLTNPNMHYVFPIDFIATDSSRDPDGQFVLHPPNPANGIREENPTNLSQAYQATKLSIFISGKICPAEPENGDLNEGWSQRDMAARTAIVLYTKSVEWLIKFGRVYQNTFHYLQSRHRIHSGVNSHPMLTNFWSILEGVTVEEFDLIGLDVAVYESEKHPVGLRAFLDDRICFSGALLKCSHNVFNENESNDRGVDASSSVRRLSFLLNDRIWIVHGVNVDARCIQLRVCTSESGSRGQPLLSLHHTSLIVGGGTEWIPTHENGLIKPHSPLLMKRGISADPFAFAQSSCEVGTKERAGQSILKHFDIQHENPFSYRESDSDAEDELSTSEAKVIGTEVEEGQNDILDEFRSAGFLLGLFSKEVRLMVTMNALESLVDIADTWVKVIVTHLPELFLDAAEIATLLERKEKAIEDSRIVFKGSDLISKNFTSLDQDPKFSGLCLQGEIGTLVSYNRTHQFEPTPYSNTESLRPFRKKSSLIVSQLERKEDLTLSQSDSSKIAQAFLMVKFEDCQISIQDQLHKGSVLVALSSSTIKHAVSLDSSHECLDLYVDGFQVFTVPLDVDVKSHATWLKALADGLYCPSSYGLLRQVIAPIPAQVTIWIDRENNLVKDKVKLDVPAVELQVNPASKRILENLITASMVIINAKLNEKKSLYDTGLLQGYLSEMRRQKRSLHQLLAITRHVKWKIAALTWRSRFTWNHHIAMTGISALKSARYVMYEVKKATVNREHKLSSQSSAIDAPNLSCFGSPTLNCYGKEQSMDELHGLTQQYEALLDLISLMTQEIHSSHESSILSNLDLEFSLDSASLTLCGENVDIIRAEMSLLSFKMQLSKDNSGKFVLILHKFSISNLSPATPFPDLLLPIYSRSWVGDEVFLRVNAEMAKPVKNTIFVQHFEVNVHPIQICITQEVILQLVTFFTPVDSTDNTKDEKREEVRSHFLQARSSSISEGRVSSAIFKAVKVAGKAAAHPLSLGRTNRGDSAAHLIQSTLKEKAETIDLVFEDPLAKLLSMASCNELLNFNSDGADEHICEPTNNDMKEGATKSMFFKRIRLGTVEVVLTYKNKKSSIGNSSTPHLDLPHASQPQFLEDMRGFEVKTRALVYCDKTCSLSDLLLRIRRDILLDVLSQVGRNFTNIGNFLRDQFDMSRFAAFDGLAPLKSLSTTGSSFISMVPSHTGVVVPYSIFLDSDTKDKDSDEAFISSTSTSFRTTELSYTRRGSDLLSDYNDTESPTTCTPTSIAIAHRKPAKVKRTLTKLFTRKKLSLLPAPSTSS